MLRKPVSYSSSSKGPQVRLRAFFRYEASENLGQNRDRVDLAGDVAHNPSMPTAASTSRVNERRRRKQNGIHYTPPELAAFLGEAVARHLPDRDGPIRVLDPACGAGGLLQAFASAVPKDRRHWLCLSGFETDIAALREADQNLSRLGIELVSLQAADFLQADGECREESRFDVVIANPPYVRTQVLGAAESQRLAKGFGLSGRVDLYHAFVRAMTNALRPGGVLGLLTSNRFLSVKSGANIRRLLRTEFEIREIYDLGDTKFFEAAVLPVVVVAVKRGGTEPTAGSPPATFDRIYAIADRFNVRSTTIAPLDALVDRTLSDIATPKGECFRIERGQLADAPDPEAVWRLSRPEYESWLDSVRANQVCTFDDVAEIRVGIKTTADKVFVRSDWEALPTTGRPEESLLHPLITHREVERWVVRPGKRRMLYPYLATGGRRRPVSLAAFPQTAAYLQSHAETLKRRTYVIDGGREWYEIWVPHSPAAWSRPKIVFPDIAAEPRFCLDESGSLVQGDCYWITLKEGVDPRWLMMMLAVANSSFITRYYDLAFHNKLYAGRRRFMTQYVKQFPLPSLESTIGRRIIAATSRILRRTSPGTRTERLLDRLVAQAFGVHRMEAGGK